MLHLNFFRGLLLFAVLWLPFTAYLQTQNIRGTVKDKISLQALEGASITIPGTNAGTVTNNTGQFVISNVPVGRIALQISYNGYKTITIPELLLTTGKELVIDVTLEEQIKEMANVTVKGSTRKGRAANEFAVASARSFRPEEVQRFAGGRNDPSKLVANYAGVAAGDDSRNDIVVRGNSPAGVLWRVEGLPTENPNHFGSLGTSGGPVPILNTNAIRQSDFFTGAFAAEFGNATSAVFDIQLREGNTARHEKTLQLNAFTGLEAMLEGPLSKKRTNASYLVGYRYSFVQIAQSLGLSIGTAAVPKYQDWVYHIDFGKGKAGRFALFGFGGISQISFKGEETDSTDFYARTDQDGFVRNHLLVFGTKYTLDLGKKAYWRTALSYSNVKDDFDGYQYPLPLRGYTSSWLVQTNTNRVNTVRLHSYVNVKQNARFNWRTGLLAESPQMKSFLADREGKPSSAAFDTLRNFDGRYNMWQAYWMGKYKPTNKLSISGGINMMYLSLSKQTQITPRANVQYEANTRLRYYVSYGMHALAQPLPIYLSQQQLPNGSIDQSNRNLKFTQAHHLVAGVQQGFANNWRLMAEAYYQWLQKVPVDAAPSGYSALNEGSNFGFSDRAGLQSRGTGRNYGVELTLERFLTRGWYVLSTLSLFNSRYKGSDDIERNTTFNYNYVYNILGGKEWAVGAKKRNAFTIDIKASTLGGRWQTPVDLPASIAAGYEILDESRFNSVQNKAYFRLDTKFGYRINSQRKKISHTLYFDLQNVTNQQNVLAQRYNPQRQQVGTVYQIGIFPDLMYRVNF